MPSDDEAEKKKKKEKDDVSEWCDISYFISKKLRVSSRLSLLLLCLCLVCGFCFAFHVSESEAHGVSLECQLFFSCWWDVFAGRRVRGC